MQEATLLNQIKSNKNQARKKTHKARPKYSKQSDVLKENKQ